MAEKFTFYSSMADALSELPASDRLAVYDAMGNYAFKGIVPTFDGIAPKVAWKLIRPLIDKAIECQETGKKGGRPKKEHRVTDPIKGGLKPPFKPDSDSDSEREVKTTTGFNPLSRADGAAAAKAAPPADYSAIINEIDAKYAEWDAQAVPCPAHLNPFGGE